MAPKAKTNFTIRSTGALFLVSAIFELLSLDSAVFLLGASRAGPAAAIYHLAYASLFAVIGVGLLVPTRWGDRAFYLGTLVYTIDKAACLVGRKALAASLLGQLGGYGDMLQLVPRESVADLLAVANVLFIVSWWGFAFYLYRRREFFFRRNGSISPGPSRGTGRFSGGRT